MDVSLPLNPASRFRPVATLHSFPDDSAEEIGRAVRSLGEAGFGGIVFEPRSARENAAEGSGDWPCRLEACLEAAETDTQWPLRIWLGENVLHEAARIVLRRDQRIVRQVLRLELLPDGAPPEEALAAPDVRHICRLGMSAEGSHAVLSPWQPGEGPAAKPGESLIVLRVCEVADAGLDGLNLLERQACRALTEDVLDGLAERFAGWIERGVLAGLLCRMPGGVAADQAPWADHLMKAFEDRWGESPANMLPALWLDVPGAPRFRQRFRAVVCDTLQNHFIEILSEWCDVRKLDFVLLEAQGDSLLDQVGRGWGANASLLTAATTPGVVEGGVLGVRQALSSSRHAGRRDTWFSGFLRAGRGNASAGFAAEGRRALAQGCSVLNADWAVASLRGDRKRLGAGGALEPSQGWWPSLRPWADEAARLGAWMDRARPRVTTLLLAPTESVIALSPATLPDTIKASPALNASLSAREISDAFQSLLSGLDALQIEYDVVEEQTLADRGRALMNALFVGPVEYTLVVVPPAFSWREETLRMLRRYARRGGAVILARPLATCIDFDPSEAIESLADEFGSVFVTDRAGREVGYQIRRLAPPPLQVRDLGETGTNEFIVRQRATETHDLFLLSNTSATSAIEARCQFDFEGAVRRLSPAEPAVGVIYTETGRGPRTFDLPIGAGGAELLAIGGEDADLSEPAAAILPGPTQTEPIEGEWHFNRIDPNIAPLRACGFEIGDRRAHVPRLLDLLRAEFLGGALPRTDAAGAPFRIELRFPFFSELVMEPLVLLALEQTDEIELRVNNTAPAADWTDSPRLSAYRTVDISALVRPGRNEIILRAPSRMATFEYPILLGNFAVHLDEDDIPVLGSEPSTLRDGTWTTQGYPFYAGQMEYRNSLDFTPDPKKRYFLRLGAPAGSVLSLRVGQHTPLLPRDASCRVEITRLLIEGENTLCITLAGGLFNALGPCHIAPRIAELGTSGPDIYDTLPAENRRFLEKPLRIAARGLIGGVSLEIHDPDAPKAAVGRSASTEEEKDENNIEENGEKGSAAK